MGFHECFTWGNLTVLNTATQTFKIYTDFYIAKAAYFLFLSRFRMFSSATLLFTPNFLSLYDGVCSTVRCALCRCVLRARCCFRPCAAFATRDSRVHAPSSFSACDCSRMYPFRVRGLAVSLTIHCFYTLCGVSSTVSLLHLPARVGT